MEPRNDLAVTYIGGPTLLIEYGGIRLLTDPAFDPPTEYSLGAYSLTKTAGPAMQPSELRHIDAVLVSHDHHMDNLDNAGRAFLPQADHTVTTKDGAERLGGNAVGLAPWETFELETADGRTLMITATPAQHGPEGGDRGPVIGFVLEFSDARERCVYVSGDTVWFDGVDQVSKRFRVFAAVLFMGAAQVAPAGPHNLTLSAQDGVKVAEQMPEALIIPVHYEGWAHFTESQEQVEGAFAKAGLIDRLLWPKAAVRTVVSG